VAASTALSDDCVTDTKTMGAGGAIGFLSPAAKRSTLAVFFLGFSLGLSLSAADSLDSIGNSHPSNSVGSQRKKNCW
jgi:hypothetical protein